MLDLSVYMIDLRTCTCINRLPIRLVYIINKSRAPSAKEKDNQYTVLCLQLLRTTGARYNSYY